MSFSSKRLPPSPFFEPDFSLLSKLLVKSQCTIYFQIGQFYKYITGQQALKMIICLFLSSLFLRKKASFYPQQAFVKCDASFFQPLFFFQSDNLSTRNNPCLSEIPSFHNRALAAITGDECEFGTLVNYKCVSLALANG